MSNARTWPRGYGHCCLRPAKPVLAFVMVVAAEMLTDLGDEGGRDRH